MKAKKRSREVSLPAPETFVGALDDGDSDAQYLSRRARRAKRSRASIYLSHDTKERRSDLKLKLHRTRLERIVESMKKRLQAWDPVAEAELVAKQKEEEKRKESELEFGKPKKKKGRLGPETWKLRGAARPAHEVYDFDVRYVDPHIKAHEAAKEKAKRLVNLLAASNKGEGKPSFLEQAGDIGREYLATLMQLAHVAQEMKFFKTARACFLDCIELDSESITTAREDLMRMFMKLGRTEAAMRLGERLKDDDSVWIRYSHALLSFREKQGDAETLMIRAIQANPLCAYYLAYYETFSSVMEYTDDVAEADDVPQSSLEEAIEYCSSKMGRDWVTSRAADELRKLLQAARRGALEALPPAAVEWSDRLRYIESEFEARMAASKDDEASCVADDENNSCHADVARSRSGDESASLEEEEVDEPPVDVTMFASMFRTAMEMLEKNGQLS